MSRQLFRGIFRRQENGRQENTKKHVRCTRWDASRLSMIFLESSEKEVCALLTIGKKYKQVQVRILSLNSSLALTARRSYSDDRKGVFMYSEIVRSVIRTRSISSSASYTMKYEILHWEVLILPRSKCGKNGFVALLASHDDSRVTFSLTEAWCNLIRVKVRSQCGQQVERSSWGLLLMLSWQIRSNCKVSKYRRRWQTASGND